MSLPSPVLTYHSVALPVSVRLENQHVDAHAAVEVIPEVMVEFSTEDDKDDDEGEHVEQERSIIHFNLAVKSTFTQSSPRLSKCTDGAV
ncbi:hypothetical protein BGX34_004076 [Mortierella sp. NVP85]|nr:hypothetical protein BGX34_004076 [Mortierella sp. NVP85]